MRHLAEPRDFLALIGLELGASDWYEVTGADLDAFELATGDPTCALFPLTLGPKFSYEIYVVDDLYLHLNYGYDGVRLGPPLTPGDAVRMRATLQHAEAVPEGVKTTIAQRFERRIDGIAVCEATSRFLYFDPPGSEPSLTCRPSHPSQEES